MKALVKPCADLRQECKCYLNTAIDVEDEKISGLFGETYYIQTTGFIDSVKLKENNPDKYWNWGEHNLYLLNTPERLQWAREKGYNI